MHQVGFYYTDELRAQVKPCILPHYFQHIFRKWISYVIYISINKQVLNLKKNCFSYLTLLWPVLISNITMGLHSGQQLTLELRVDRAWSELKSSFWCYAERTSLIFTLTLGWSEFWSDWNRTYLNTFKLPWRRMEHIHPKRRNTFIRNVRTFVLFRIE